MARSSVLIAVFASLTALHILGVEQGNRINGLLTIVKLLPLVLLAAVGLFSVRHENLVSDAPFDSSSLARTSAILIFAFAGIETALIPSGEVQNSARTVPRAIAIAMLGITLLYIALHSVAQGVLGSDLPGQSTPLAEAAGMVFGDWGKSLLLAGMTISMFGYISGMTLAVPRALFAFARDGFLPRIVASVNPRFKTPHVALIAQGVISCVLALTNGFEKLAILANLSVLLVYAACCVAVIKLRSMNVAMGGEPFRIPGGKLVPFAALAVIAWLLTSITITEWLVVIGTVLAGVVAYGVLRLRRTT